METLILPEESNKLSIYEAITPQIQSLLEIEDDLIANMANMAAVLKEALGFFWVGFYIVKQNEADSQELVLGPFQGPLACTRIKYGKGVCGYTWQKGETVIVPDVDAFPGHIACSSLSKSEIVVPVYNNGKIVAVLDVDSDESNMFDEIDKKYLEKIVTFLFE